MKTIEKFWRRPVIADIPRKLKARFMPESYKQLATDKYFLGKLIGYIEDDFIMWVVTAPPFAMQYSTPDLEVYDPPQPPEGYRLVDIDTDKPDKSDIYYDNVSDSWCDLPASMFDSTAYKSNFLHAKKILTRRAYNWEELVALTGRRFTVMLGPKKLSFTVNKLAMEEDGVIRVENYNQNFLLDNAVWEDDKSPYGVTNQ